jgi:hypothetical protein
MKKAPDLLGPFYVAPGRSAPSPSVDGARSRQLPLSKNCIHAVFVEPPTSEVGFLPKQA